MQNMQQNQAPIMGGKNLMRASGRIGYLDESCDDYVTYFSLQSPLNDKTQYIIYKCFFKYINNDFFRADIFMNDSIPEARETIKHLANSKIAAEAKSETEIDKLIYTYFSEYGNIQVQVTADDITHNNDYYDLESEGFFWDRRIFREPAKQAYDEHCKDSDISCTIL